MNFQMRRMELWAGFFLGSGLVIIVGFIVLLGGAKSILTRGTQLTTSCDRTYGLRAGSLVKMIDLAVGSVEKVTVDQRGNVTIDFSVASEYVNLVRQSPDNADLAKGSVVMLRMAGMGIGDSFLELNKGDEALPVVSAGQKMPFVKPQDKIEETMGSVKKLVDALNDDRHTLGKMLNDKGAYYEQILRTLTNTADITAKTSVLMDKITSRDGTIGAFLNDRKFYDNTVGLQEQTHKLMGGLIEVTRNAADLTKQFGEIAKRQDELYAHIASIMKKGDVAVDSLAGVLKKTEAITDQFMTVAKNLALVSDSLPELTEKGTQTMTAARDVMNALKRNFLIRPFIPQPADDRLLELIPRGGEE